jgi:cell division protein ZapA
MGQVAVTINGRTFGIACDDGQEEHLQRLASYVNERIDELLEKLGPVGEFKLLAMVSLLIADELGEVYNELDDLRRGAAKPPAEGGEDAAVAALDQVAGQIEAIAARLGPA